MYIIQLQNVQYALITQKFFKSAQSRGTTQKFQVKKERDNLKTLKTKQKGSKKPKVTKCITAGYAACHKITTKILILDANHFITMSF